MLKKAFDLIGWLGTGLVFGAVAVRFLRPEMQQVWYGLAVAGLGCVLLYVLSQWREIARGLSGRQARLGTLAGASVAIVLAILVAINYIASKQNRRWDLTAAQQFTLSDQTKRVLQGLSGPVQVRVYGREDDFDRFRSRLNEFEYASKQVAVEYIDVDRNPARARQDQVQSYGTAVFEYQGRLERSTSDTEQELANTLIKVVEGQQKKVYFVQGHGEKDTASADRAGYNGIAEALGRDNFTVDKLVLAQQADVPADASVVVVAGPRIDLLPGEAEALRRYLRKGGKLLLLIDPPEGRDAASLANVLALAKEWGVEVGNDIVVDVSGVGQLIGTDASVPVAATYPSHAITENFSFLTAFPLARSITTATAEGRTPQVFIETSPRSWAETDITSLTTSGKVELNADKGDRQGPIAIAAAVSQAAAEPPPVDLAGDASKDPAAKDPAAPKPETRVAVVGDSDFAANYALGIQGNRDLMLNTINWLAQQENLIAVRPREPEDRRVTMTAEQQQRVFLLSVFLIPGAVIAAGVYTWWRRR
jgi:ABC-type uncharacterized transport system involved in gliding motility auxiliary subunit